MSGRRVLVLSPHPDDEAVGCGGTLRLHADHGAAIKTVFLTSGEAGGHDLPASEAGPLREKEARLAAEILGIGAVDFWRRPDGRLRSTSALVARVRREVEAWGAEIVYAPHGGEAHADHRAAARIATKALMGLDVELLQFEVWTPLARMDEIVDITPTIDAKVAAIRSYESQCRVMRFDDAFRGLARYRGEMFSWPEGEYAEVFVQGNG